MHRSSGLTGKYPANDEPSTSVSWKGVKSVEEWLETQPVDSWKQTFTDNGYLKIDDLVNEVELQVYRVLYNQMMSGKIDTSTHRHDLGNHEPKKGAMENITQIMWPSVFVGQLAEGPIHQRAGAIARIILGDDMVHDFDMLIAKPAQTKTEVPWHQDESYWPDMSDKRAVTCWCPMEAVFAENGCMWFVPGSHKGELRKHRPAAPGVHVLTCCDAVGDDEGKPVPLKAGGATFHSGRTCHHTRGNTTDNIRRAFIVNYRPKDMVEYERSIGFDHGEMGVDKILSKGQTHSQEVE